MFLLVGLVCVGSGFWDIHVGYAVLRLGVGSQYYGYGTYYYGYGTYLHFTRGDSPTLFWGFVSLKFYVAALCIGYPLFDALTDYFSQTEEESGGDGRDP